MVEYLLGIPALAGTITSAYLGWRVHSLTARVADLESANATVGRLLSASIARATAAEAELEAAQNAARKAEIDAAAQNPDGAADRLNSAGLPLPAPR